MIDNVICVIGLHLNSDRTYTLGTEKGTWVVRLDSSVVLISSKGRMAALQLAQDGKELTDMVADGMSFI